MYPSPDETSNMDMRVSELMLDTNGMWDIDLINNTFPTDVNAAILATPLSSRRPVDTLFWSQTEDGVFFVKSCYWLARTSGRVLTEGDDGSEDAKLWRGILHLKGLQSCSILFRVVVETWRHSNLVNLFKGAPVDSFKERWSWLESKLKVKDLRTLGALMWDSWFCRNKVVFSNERLNYVLVAIGFARLVEEHCDYKKKVTCVPSVSNRRTASNAAAWLMGLRAVARDVDGRLLFSGVHCIPYTIPSIAEEPGLQQDTVSFLLEDSGSGEFI
uniref:Uncharacterized protein n=1 Tax=Chenopodium quinoa TaxID=63459 RepID=A0A803MI84_CHEQI